MADDQGHGPTGGLGFTPLSRDGELINQCVGCARYNGSKKCDAFPNGIPEAVWDGVILHNRPIDGDNGLQWAEPVTLEPMPTIHNAEEV